MKQATIESLINKLDSQYIKLQDIRNDKKYSKFTTIGKRRRALAIAKQFVIIAKVEKSIISNLTDGL